MEILLEIVCLHCLGCPTSLTTSWDLAVLEDSFPWSTTSKAVQLSLKALEEPEINKGNQKLKGQGSREKKSQVRWSELIQRSPPQSFPNVHLETGGSRENYILKLMEASWVGEMRTEFRTTSLNGKSKDHRNKGNMEKWVHFPWSGSLTLTEHDLASQEARQKASAKMLKS